MLGKSIVAQHLADLVRQTSNDMRRLSGCVAKYTRTDRGTKIMTVTSSVPRSTRVSRQPTRSCSQPRSQGRWASGSSLAHGRSGRENCRWNQRHGRGTRTCLRQFSSPPIQSRRAYVALTGKGCERLAASVPLVEQRAGSPTGSTTCAITGALRRSDTSEAWIAIQPAAYAPAPAYAARPRTAGW